MRAHLAAVASAILALGSGCTLISDVDRFREIKDFVLDVRDFSPHIESYLDAQLINVGDDDVLAGRIVLDPLPEGDFAMALLDSLDPDLTYRVDFFADTNANRTYDPPLPDGTAVDHGWREPVPSDGIVVFPHSFNFTNLAEGVVTRGGTFRLHLFNASMFDGEAVDVTVTNDSGHQVGYYRLGRATGGDIDIAIDGIIDLNVAYLVGVSSPTRYCELQVTAMANLVIDEDATTLVCQTF